MNWPFDCQQNTEDENRAFITYWYWTKKSYLRTKLFRQTLSQTSFITNCSGHRMGYQYIHIKNMSLILLCKQWGSKCGISSDLHCMMWHFIGFARLAKTKTMFREWNTNLVFRWIILVQYILEKSRFTRVKMMPCFQILNQIVTHKINIQHCNYVRIPTEREREREREREHTQKIHGQIVGRNGR